MRKDLSRNTVPFVPSIILYHTGFTSFSHALPEPPLFNTISFIMYQAQTLMHHPHICCERRSLPATAMIWLQSHPQLNKYKSHLQVCRHQGVCLSRLSTSLPLVQLTRSLSNAKVKRKRRGKSLQLCSSLLISCNYRDALTGESLGWQESGEYRGGGKMSNFRGRYIKGIILNRMDLMVLNH